MASKFINILKSEREVFLMQKSYYTVLLRDEIHNSKFFERKVFSGVKLCRLINSKTKLSNELEITIINVLNYRQHEW